MAIASLLPLPRFVAYAPGTGEPLIGGMVRTFVPGGSTPKQTWQDAAQTIPNPQPIVLDSAGSALIYGNGQYQITVTDSFGNQIPGYSGISEADPISSFWAPILQSPDAETVATALDFARLHATNAFAVPGTFDNAAMHDGNSFMVNGASSTTEFQFSHPGNFSTEALASGIIVPPTATNYTANAFGAYVQNQSTMAAGASAGFFYARNTVPGATVFALNPLVTDQTNVGLAGVASTVVGAEFDIGAYNLATKAYGINMLGVFPNGTPATTIAYQVAVLNSPWAIAYLTGDGAAVTGLQLGSVATTANSDAQAINMTARDATNTPHLIGIQATHNPAGANLTLTTPTGIVQTSGGVSTGGNVLINATATTLMGFFSGGSAVGTITTNGTTTAYNTTSDYRIKTVTGLSTGDCIDEFTVHMGHFNAHPEQTLSFMLAHEVQAVMPFVVIGAKDALNEDGSMKLQMLDYSMLVPELVAKCQVLKKAIDTLAADFTAYKTAHP
jgi:hypothetical protein